MASILQITSNSNVLTLLAKAVVIPFLGLLLYRLYLNASDKRKGWVLPPKPKGLPVIGNLHQILRATSKGQQHLLLHQWAQEHGEIFGVQAGPVTQYYLNSDVAVKELYDRDSAYTAERPRWIVSNEHICGQKNVLLLNASDPRWKQQRKAITSAMASIPRADAGLPFLHFETAKFLHEIVSNPSIGLSSSSMWSSVGRYTYSTFASISFGMDVPTTDNPVIDYIHEAGLAPILGTLPGWYIVDIMPWLDHLPLFLKPWERAGRGMFRRDEQWSVQRLQRVEAAIARGETPDAFLYKVLQHENLLGFPDEEEAAYLAMQLIIAAADTSRMSTWSFLEAMLLHPDVQERGREEIEKVVGDRLPAWDDFENIPYVRCMMKELWRWRPPVSLGHPHRTTRDLTYGQYVIPKGSRLHLNAWAIGHDPNRHHDPDRYWPERYTHDTTTTMQSLNSSNVRQRDHFAFGAGRRVCPGYHIAERSLAVAIMRLLWAFKISPSPNAKLPLNPADYPAMMPGNPGVNMPFTLTILNEKKKRIIEKTFEEECQARQPMEPLA